MNQLLKINWISITLLSFVAALPKILRMPREIDFFAGVGMGELSVVALGLLQLLGGVLLLFLRTRLVGASIASITFLVSAVFLFVKGSVLPGLLFVIPVLMADIVIFSCIRGGSAGGRPADAG